MTHLRDTVALSFVLLLGCTNAHAPAPDITEPIPVEVITAVEADTLFPPEMSSLETCLLAGGALTEVASVNNNDTTEHGSIRTFVIAPDRRIAVASEDGSIKLWTLDGFIETFDPGAFLYGAEVEGSQVADLAFLGDSVVAGDVRGVVSAWQSSSPNIIGGTDPDVGITAVAVDEARRWVAHADEQVGGNVMVRAVDEPTTFGPLETTMRQVNDLAFVRGQLLLAGYGELPSLELRAADDPTRVIAAFETDRSFGALTEAAVSAAGQTIAFVSIETLGVVNDALELRWITDGVSAHVPLSVDVTDAGRAVFTVGAEGSLRAWAGLDGAALAMVPVVDPVAVRVDSTGDLVVVGSRDGLLHAFSCTE